jgi:hypothetical protein
MFNLLFYSYSKVITVHIKLENSLDNRVTIEIRLFLFDWRAHAFLFLFFIITIDIEPSSQEF